MAPRLAPARVCPLSLCPRAQVCWRRWGAGISGLAQFYIPIGHRAVGRRGSSSACGSSLRWRGHSVLPDRWPSHCANARRPHPQDRGRLQTSLSEGAAPVQLSWTSSGPRRPRALRELTGVPHCLGRMVQPTAHPGTHRGNSSPTTSHVVTEGSLWAVRRVDSSIQWGTSDMIRCSRHVHMETRLTALTHSHTYVHSHSLTIT